MVASVADVSYIKCVSVNSLNLSNDEQYVNLRIQKLQAQQQQNNYTRLSAQVIKHKIRLKNKKMLYLFLLK